VHPYVELAFKAVREYATTGKKTAVPSPLPPEFKKRAGAFVSLKKDGDLRGCIGTLQPTRENLAEEIIENGIAAASRDTRFRPVREDELQDIAISVDVLSPPEDISSEEELDPKIYGVIVTSGLRRGVLLPDLEGVETPEQQIDICKWKVGIPPEAEVSLQRFRVTRYR